MAVALDVLRSGIGVVLVGFGMLLSLGGGVSALRFPDLYTRLHAVLVIAWGAVAIILGVAAASPDLAMAARLIVLALLVGAVAPVMTQMLANAAHTGGLAPIAGRYSAPSGGKAARDE